nr:NADH dehydrogenase subunit 2 [Actornithophilus grandiceps]
MLSQGFNHLSWIWEDSWGPSILATLFLMFIYFSFCFLIISGSKTFWVLWIGLEVMNFLVTPWFSYYEKLNMKIKVFNYFMIQVISSGLFLISSMLMTSNKWFFVGILSSMMMKLGAFPFHSWVFKVSEMMNWSKFHSLLTWVKVGPLSVFSSIPISSSFMLLFIFGLLMSWGGFYSNSIRMIMIYSSVAHNSWLLISLCLSKFSTLSYLISYWLLVVSIGEYLKCKGVSKITDLVNIQVKELLFMGSLLGMSALPPFLGFFPKILVLSMMTENHLYLEVFLSILGSLIPLLFYSKLCIMFFFISSKFNLSLLNVWNLPLFPMKTMLLLILNLIFSVVLLVSLT